jgi:hypothetical protein
LAAEDIRRGQSRKTWCTPASRTLWTRNIDIVEPIVSNDRIAVDHPGFVVASSPVKACSSCTPSAFRTTRTMSETGTKPLLARAATLT